MKNKIIFSCLVLLSYSSIYSLDRLKGFFGASPSNASAGNGTGAGGSPSNGAGAHNATINTDPDHLAGLVGQLNRQPKIPNLHNQSHRPSGSGPKGIAQAAASAASDIRAATENADDLLARAQDVSANGVTITENLKEIAESIERTVQNLALLKSPASPLADNGAGVFPPAIASPSAGPGSTALVSTGGGAGTPTALTPIQNGHYHTLPAKLNGFSPIAQPPVQKTDPMAAAVATSANAAKTAAHLENATGNAAKAIENAAPAAIAASSNFKAFGDALNAASKRIFSPSGAFVGAGFTAIFYGIKLRRDAAKEKSAKLRESLKNEGNILIVGGAATLITVAFAKWLQKSNATPAA